MLIRMRDTRRGTPIVSASMGTRILAFIRAFGVRWFIAMSGGLGVPLTVASYFVAGDVAKVILFLTGVGCAVFSSFWVWAVEHEARQKAEAIVFHPFIDIGQSFLFSEQPKYETWKAKITPTKSTDSVQVCLDYSAFSGGIGYNFWNHKGRLILTRGVNFVKDANVSIDLMELDNNSPTRFWRWKTDADGSERPLVSLTSHRCQLVFIAEQETLDYFDFLVTFHDATPSLIGEHMFLYARDWKTTR
jgi:hypothetical protein